ncbi:MAG TPA: glycosyltransferase family 2 protein [Candidatus Saccharimonadales bacterium]|nr:glycosyltransferase family 2 protein [Candidatus Saccharimonadales bacterium]
MVSATVLVPAYNEEQTIIRLLERVRAQSVDGVQFEVVVVDDASQDSTVSRLESRPDLYDHLIKRQQNGGKGAAVRDGLRKASSEYVLFQDADLEYDPADYARLFGPVLSHDADVVLGSRLVASPVTRVHYFWHKVGNSFLTLLFNVVHNTTFTDIYTCYVLFRKELIDPDKLGTSGWEQQAEILSRLARSAKSIYEVPISYFGRTYDEGKKIRPVHAIAVAFTIITERLKPLSNGSRERRRDHSIAAAKNDLSETKM